MIIPTKHKKHFLRLSSILHLIEVGLALICVAFVLYGAFYIFSDVGYFQATVGEFGIKEGFEDFLSYILLLVVGVELAIMLVQRTPESLIEVMFFVVARKMLIKTEHSYELLIGVLSLAVLFSIRKYLTTPKEHLVEMKSDD